MIFNLAGQVSHIDSMTDPKTDLEINGQAQLSLLEALRADNPDAKVVFAASRQQYGRPRELPVTEDHPMEPGRRERDQPRRRRALPPPLHGRLRDPDRLAAPHQHLRAAPADEARPPGLHHDVHPPRPRRGGDRRSSATARSCATSPTSTTRSRRSSPPRSSEEANGQALNVGGIEPVSLLEVAELCQRIAGHGRAACGSFPGPRSAAGSTSARSTWTTPGSRRLTGWAPTVTLADGLERTIDFYRRHREHYWN